MNTKYLAASCAFRRSASEGRRGCSSCSYKLKIGPLIGLEIYSNRQWFYCVKDLPIVTEDGDLYAVLTFGLDQSTLPLHTAGVQAVLVPWLCSDPTALGLIPVGSLILSEQSVKVKHFVDKPGSECCDFMSVIPQSPWVLKLPDFGWLWSCITSRSFGCIPVVERSRCVGVLFSFST